MLCAGFPRCWIRCTTRAIGSCWFLDRKSTRLNSSHTEIYTFPYTTLFRSYRRKVRIISRSLNALRRVPKVLDPLHNTRHWFLLVSRSEEHTSELQSHRDLHFSLHDALPILPP